MLPGSLKGAHTRINRLKDKTVKGKGQHPLHQGAHISMIRLKKHTAK